METAHLPVETALLYLRDNLILYLLPCSSRVIPFLFQASLNASSSSSPLSSPSSGSGVSLSASLPFFSALTLVLTLYVPKSAISVEPKPPVETPSKHEYEIE